MPRSKTNKITWNKTFVHNPDNLDERYRFEEVVNAQYEC